MKTNQITPEANQSQNNNETILRTLDNADLENLSGGASEYHLKIESVDNESAGSSDTVIIPVTIRREI